jgi:SlyX protein
VSNREPRSESEEKSPESRLLRVEERIAWLERHVIEQDRAMLEMAETLERLKQELVALRATGAGAGGREGSAAKDADERPPHY